MSQTRSSLLNAISEIMPNVGNVEMILNLLDILFNIACTQDLRQITDFGFLFDLKSEEINWKLMDGLLGEDVETGLSVLNNIIEKHPELYRPLKYCITNRLEDNPKVVLSLYESYTDIIKKAIIWACGRIRSFCVIDIIESEIDGIIKSCLKEEIIYALQELTAAKHNNKICSILQKLMVSEDAYIRFKARAIRDTMQSQHVLYSGRAMND